MENQKLNSQMTALKDAYITGRIVPDIEIAKAAMTALDDYRWLPFPTQPKKVQEYLKLPRDVRKKMNKQPEGHREFWEDLEVKRYFDTKLKISNLNERNRDFLEWMKKILPEEEAAIDVKLYRFRDMETYHDFLKEEKQIEQPSW